MVALPQLHRCAKLLPYPVLSITAHAHRPLCRTIISAQHRRYAMSTTTGKSDMQAVLFDLDGTLVESKRIWFDLMNACRLHYQYPALQYDTWQHTFGQSMEMNREKFFPEQTQQQINDFCDEHYADHVHSLEIYPDATATLKHCADRYHGNVVCVTNCPRPITNVILPKTEFRQYFKHVVCARDVVDYDVSQLYTHTTDHHTTGSSSQSDQHDVNMQIHADGGEQANGQQQQNGQASNVQYSLQPKKSPDTLLHACKLLGVKPETAYFIGDTKHDMEAAEAAGSYGIGVAVDGGQKKISKIGELRDLI